MAYRSEARTERNDRAPAGAERGERGERPAGGKPFFRRRRSCPLSEKGAPAVDYKNVKMLSRYISERGKIMPKRITSICAKKQRALAREIKRARHLALLPFIQN